MSTTETQSNRNQSSLGRLIALPLISRSLIDTTAQIYFPFLPALAQGLGITSARLSQILAIRSLMGLLVPLTGTLADRFGYRRSMRIALLGIALGLGLFALGPSLPLRIAGLMLSGIAGFSFVPTMQAYLSHHLPYTIRARGIGIVEYGWAFAGIVGLSTTGWIITRTDWTVPFLILAVAMVGLFFLYLSLPGGRIATQSALHQATTRGAPLIQRLPSLSRSAWATVCVTGCVSFSLFNILLVFGEWLTTGYGLLAEDMGRVAMFMGVADLGGSVITSLFSDRMGKRNSVLGGSALSCLAFLLLPGIGRSLIGCIVGLSLIRFAIEFTIVTQLAFASEQAPAQRGQMMSLVGAAAFASTSLSGFTAPWLYQRMGIAGPSFMAALVMALSVLINLLFMREPLLRD